MDMTGFLFSLYSFLGVISLFLSFFRIVLYVRWYLCIGVRVCFFFTFQSVGYELRANWNCTHKREKTKNKPKEEKKNLTVQECWAMVKHREKGLVVPGPFCFVLGWSQQSRDYILPWDWTTHTHTHHNPCRIV
jgi:hypothetical protein